MHTIMVNTEKGGAGKTTLSTLLAAGLSAHGFSVLLVDLDHQSHATLSFGLKKQPGIYNVLAREERITEWWQFVAPERYLPPGATCDGELYLLPSNDETMVVPILSSGDDALFEALEDVEDDIDFVVIDTPPSAGGMLAKAWYASDYVLIPSQMEALSVDGTINTVRRAHKSDVQILGIVPNQFRENTQLHQMYYEQLKSEAAAADIFMFPPISLSIAWAEASSSKLMITAPDGVVGKARSDAIRFINLVLKRLQVVQHG